MKRIFAVLLVAVILLSLVACGNISSAQVDGYTLTGSSSDIASNSELTDSSSIIDSSNSVVSNVASNDEDSSNVESSKPVKSSSKPSSLNNDSSKNSSSKNDKSSKPSSKNSNSSQTSPDKPSSASNNQNTNDESSSISNSNNNSSNVYPNVLTASNINDIEIFKHFALELLNEFGSDAIIKFNGRTVTENDTRLMLALMNYKYIDIAVIGELFVEFELSDLLNLGKFISGFVTETVYDNIRFRYDKFFIDKEIGDFIVDIQENVISKNYNKLHKDFSNFYMETNSGVKYNDNFWLDYYIYMVVPLTIDTEDDENFELVQKNVAACNCQEVYNQKITEFYEQLDLTNKHLYSSNFSSSNNSSSQVSSSKPTHTHNFSEPTCTEPAKCVCGSIDGIELGHDFGTDFSPCERCGTIYCEYKKEHIWNEATCLTPKTCMVCGITIGDINDVHIYHNNQCIQCGSFDDESKHLAKTIINEIIQEDWQEWKKVKAIHDYLCENVTYDIENYTNNCIPQDSYGVLGALKNKTAVCSGYALSFELLCETINIECEYVSGTNTKGSAHAWNQVKIDGKWYNIDVTWDDLDKQIITGLTYFYEYFLVDDESFYITHKTTNAKQFCNTKLDSMIDEEINCFMVCMACGETVNKDHEKCNCGCAQLKKYHISETMWYKNYKKCCN